MFAFIFEWCEESPGTLNHWMHLNFSLTCFDNEQLFVMHLLIIRYFYCYCRDVVLILTFPIKLGISARAEELAQDELEYGTQQRLIQHSIEFHNIEHVAEQSSDMFKWHDKLISTYSKAVAERGGALYVSCRTTLYLFFVTYTVAVFLCMQ